MLNIIRPWPKLPTGKFSWKILASFTGTDSPVIIAQNGAVLSYGGRKLMHVFNNHQWIKKQHHQDSLDRSPMPINADPNHGIDPNVDQCRSIPINAR